MRCQHCYKAECPVSKSQTDQSGFVSTLQRNGNVVKIVLNWFRINSITSIQSWVPGQILICPVQSHPTIHLKGWLKQSKLDFVEGFAILNQRFRSQGGVHLKNGHFFIKVEVYERHAEVNLDWFGMVVHLGRKSKIRYHR